MLAWFSWSWVTYSTLLPNTFAAKRNLDIPAMDLVWQGLRYIRFSVIEDPVSGVALLAGVAVAFWLGTPVVRAWGSGVIVYLVYVIWIGGDFMVGRFLAVPVLVAVFTSWRPSGFPLSGGWATCVPLLRASGSA